MSWKSQELPLNDSNYNTKKELSSDKTELFDSHGQSRGFYSDKNRLNDLTGKEWVFWTRSVITKQYPPNMQHKLRSRHGGQKPPELCADLINIFTKKGQKVLDPFMGVGGVLLGASLAGRIAVGIEITEEWIRIYEKVCELEGIDKQRTIPGDSALVLEKMDEPFDFILTDVPYWNMDKLEKSKGMFKKTGERSRENTKSKLSSFNDKLQNKEEWLKEMEHIFRLTYNRLKEKGYLAVFIGEMYRNGQYHFLPYELTQILGAIGYIPKANLVWYDVSNSLHVYGYLYDYIPSLIHQNILIFRKQ
jgi:DNA modification methylase